MINITNNNIVDIAISSTPIEKAYISSQLVWEKSSPILPYDAQVEYLEGDGSSYIDTGYCANSETSVEMLLRAKSPTQAMGIFSTKVGCRFSIYQLNKSSSRSFRLQVGYSSNGGASYYNYQSNTSFDLSYPTALKKNKFYFNGTLRNTFAEDSFTTTDTIPLFAARLTTGIDSRMFNGRIYWCKIWDDENLVRDFIPVRKNGVGYMYDRVSGQLFGNANSTGAFILGPDKT